MPRIKVQVGHSLSKDEAVKRIRQALANLKTRFAGQIEQLNEAWYSDQCVFSAKAKGVPTTGFIFFKENEVEINATIPFFIILLKGKIESALRDELKRRLV